MNLVTSSQMRDLEGRADIILFSWKPGVSLFKPWTWVTEARWGRFFHLLG